jgi:hypothetical protein
VHSTVRRPFSTPLLTLLATKGPYADIRSRFRLVEEVAVERVDVFVVSFRQDEACEAPTASPPVYSLFTLSTRTDISAAASGRSQCCHIGLVARVLRRGVNLLVHPCPSAITTV